METSALPVRAGKLLAACLTAGIAVVIASESRAAGGHISLSGGQVESESTASVGLALHLGEPDGHGLQLEGLHESIGDTEFSGIGVHAFRNFDNGSLAGLVGGVARNREPGLDTQDLTALGVEGQVPVDRLLLAAQAGIVDSRPGEDDLFLVTNATWYGNGWTAAGGTRDTSDNDLRYVEGAMRVRPGPRPSLWAYLGLTDGDGQMTYGGIEVSRPRWAPEATLFVELATGDDGYDHALAGIRLPFGTRMPTPALSIFDPVTASGEGLLPASGMRGQTLGSGDGGRSAR